MQKSTLARLLGIVLILGACITTWAQNYSSTVMSLNPAGYWPLNETAQPAMPISLTATNSGSLGTVGNGYYGAWYQPSGATWYLKDNIAYESGPLTGDQALNCQFTTGGQYIVIPRNTNGVANSAITIKPPFSVEAWVNLGSVNNSLMTIAGEGSAPMNTGGPNSTNQFYGGAGLSWAGFSFGTYTTYFFFDCFETNGESKANELDSPHTLTTGNWVYVVCTYDGANEIMYTNGVECSSKPVGANSKGLTYVPDPTTPLVIGAGPDVPDGFYGAGDNAFWGGLAEVAIYNQALSSSQVANHYSAATSVANYTNVVFADSPTIYFRMNDGQFATNVVLNTATLPVANNLGSVGSAGNGVYQPGTTPGVAGPAFGGFSSPSYSVALNGWLGGVDIGNSNLPAVLNPSGTNAITEICWFQTGPADSPARLQAMLGRNTNSFLGLGTAYGEVNFNPGVGTAQSASLDFSSAAQVDTNGFAFNDGNWHMAAGVSDGTNQYLYLDGTLALSKSGSGGINLVPATSDMLLGGVPQYTIASKYSVNGIDTFDGQIAQVAFWNTNLSAAQIQSIFNAAEVPPYIASEPVSSLTANQGQNVMVNAAVRGSSVSYQWYENGVAVAGQTGSSLIFNDAVATNSGAYYLVASSAYGSATSSVVSVTIYGPPAIAQQTAAQLEIFSGSSPSLYVTANGIMPITYQWTLNGTSIPGATNSVYTVTDITANGTYGCNLTNSLGNASITPIVISVLTDPSAPYPTQVLANHPIAYWRLDEAPNALTAYDYVGGYNATYTNVITGNVGSPLPGYAPQSDPNEAYALFGYENAAGQSNNYAGNVPPYLNLAEPKGSNAEFSVEAWVQESGYNQVGDCIVGEGYGNGGEQFVLDTGAGGAAGDLRFFMRNYAGTSFGASSTMSIFNDGLWHHVVGVCDEAGGHLYLYLDGTNVASTAITNGAGLQAATLPLSIGARESGNPNPPNYDFQWFGPIDDVAIYNKALTPAQIEADYQAVGFAPSSLVVQPSDLVTNQGAIAIFTATVQGTQPFSYQWTDNHGNIIPWATTATLALTNVQPSQAGNYTVTVQNGYGSATFSATLNVTQAPQIVQDVTPANVIAYSGSPVTLSIQASGTPPLVYQWYFGGAAVAGATNSSYTFGALLGTNTYHCTVTNIYSAGNPTVSGTATVVGVAGRGTVAPANFNSRLKITFSGYTNSETLQYFPALVRLSTNLPGFDYAEFAGANGSDLRFADSTGTNELPYEMDQWDDSNGVSSAWVQVPSLSGGTNNFIWAYWGNPAATTPPNYTTNGAVWEPASFLGLPGYDVVYHLKESGFPYVDSTTNYPSLTGIAPTPVQGIVGYGELFNNANGDYLNAGMINLSNEFTESVWVYLFPNESNIQGLWDNGPGGFGTAEADLFINDYNTSGAPGDGALLFGTDNDQPETATGLVGTNQWILLTAAVNHGTGAIQFYVNGAPEPLSSNGQSGTSTDFPTDYDMNLGRFTATTNGGGGAFAFDGIMDEARIHAGIDDSNWVWADYQTVANNSTFSVYSSVTNTITLPINLTIHLSGNHAILNWPAGTLQSAGNVNGPYSNVPGATPPYTNTVSGTQQYYRVQAQLP